ncbi:hypothetical protein BT96DRAFT_1096959 [Gymnopus androsaceus JB14]|uniref:Fungal-type protein kinase domain-containing protein n=1 Tax=Gymnopus androsaceus JB14 TaxID=1447944 RepID=A0A6A4GGK6_9AGAR|nr:hypothetical protein BT96DRAFT_1096959 [Gymnopus androsaceus JB14]
MAILCSVKSSHQWTESELHTFNVSTIGVDASTFFGVKELPVVQISPLILNNDMKPRGPLSEVSNDDRLFFSYLFCALTEDKAAVNDFAQFILRLLHFGNGERFICSRMVLPFTMYEKTVLAKPDISIVKVDGEHLLLAQVDKHGTSNADLLPRLIAEAIAAFGENNRTLAQQGRPTLHQKTFPAVSFAGVTPIFYRIPVTQQLGDAVARGEYPSQPTVVQSLVPPVPNVQLYSTRSEACPTHKADRPSSNALRL